MATTKNKLPKWLTQQIDDVNKTNLVVYWWNRGSKTLDYKGDLKEYLQRKNIKITKRVVLNTDGSVYKLTYYVKVSVSSVEAKLKCLTYDDAVLKGIHTYLTFMGDKSQFWFGGRTFSVNYHR